MDIIVVGINHRTASVDVRGQVTFLPEQMLEAHRDVVAHDMADEVVLLSTCNRTEIYAAGGKADAQALTAWLESFHGLEAGCLADHLYVHRDAEAVRHLMKVASGLDSLVLGEPQILGQLKQAYQFAREAGTTRTLLEKLFQTSFGVAKRVRTETDIGASAVSVASAAVSLARQVFGDLARTRALLVGAGETIELVARHLKGQGCEHIVVANRTRSRAQIVADAVDASVASLEDIPRCLEQSDLLITSTGSPLPLVGKGMVESALQARRHRPIFMVDLAVPPDIEREVGELRDVYLYGVDDLQSVIEDNMRSRELAREQAMDIIAMQVNEFMRWRSSLASVDVIKSFRGRFEDIRDAELQRALGQLGREKPEVVLQQLANRLTNKFLHQPTLYLQNAEDDERHHKAEHIQQIFRLRNANKE